MFVCVIGIFNTVTINNGTLPRDPSLEPWHYGQAELQHHDGVYLQQAPEELGPTLPGGPLGYGGPPDADRPAELPPVLAVEEIQPGNWTGQVGGVPNRHSEQLPAHEEGPAAPTEQPPILDEGTTAPTERPSCSSGMERAKPLGIGHRVPRATKPRSASWLMELEEVSSSEDDNSVVMMEDTRTT